MCISSWPWRPLVGSFVLHLIPKSVYFRNHKLRPELAILELKRPIILLLRVVVTRSWLRRVLQFTVRVVQVHFYSGGSSGLSKITARNVLLLQMLDELSIVQLVQAYWWIVSYFVVLIAVRLGFECSVVV